jgi:(R)-2-hydroxyacyl-CoA dehydratese activating ATPase
MKVGGIDIGSRYIKYVTVTDSDSIVFHKVETGHDPLSVCQKLLNNDRPDRLIATGYGRHLLEIHTDVRTITEIKAVAKGVRAFFPGCGTIIDIGGQDTKAISLNAEGRVTSFEMNDRCAAGTGRFLEIMAKALGYEMENFGTSCSDKPGTIKINSLCTVFAESEVVGLITKGENRGVIARAIHESIIQRILPLVQRIGLKDDIVFAGGCAMNPRLRQYLEERLQKKVHIHDNPFIHAAYGAALYAREDD